jgi:hypothetical protein
VVCPSEDGGHDWACRDLAGRSDGDPREHLEFPVLYQEFPFICQRAAKARMSARRRPPRKVKASAKAALSVPYRFERISGLPKRCRRLISVLEVPYRSIGLYSKNSFRYVNGFFSEAWFESG